MTLALAHRKEAIKARLDEVLSTGYGHFDVRLARARKHQPRQIQVSWVVFPFEDTVHQALGDLNGDDVTFERRLVWSCGRFHTDTRDAWEAHEGADHLVDNYDGCCGYDLPNRYLPEETEEELRADGETFESACVPGNHLPCPTCGGGARILSSDRKRVQFDPCPDCVRLGTDKGMFPGILNLDIPEHLAFYQSRIDQIRAEATAKANREQVKRDKAKALPSTYAPPQWLPLPTRDAGIINGIPVIDRVGCDYLTHPDNPDRRILCSNDARWFDPTTGLRVCTRHKDQPGRLP